MLWSAPRFWNFDLIDWAALPTWPPLEWSNFCFWLFWSEIFFIRSGLVWPSQYLTLSHCNIYACMVVFIDCLKCNDNPLYGFANVKAWQSGPFSVWYLASRASMRVEHPFHVKWWMVGLFLSPSKGSITVGSTLGGDDLHVRMALIVGWEIFQKEIMLDHFWVSPWNMCVFIMLYHLYNQYCLIKLMILEKCILLERSYLVLGMVGCLSRECLDLYL